LVFMSPRNSPRVTPRNNRFDMDIEVSDSFAEGDGTVDLMTAFGHDNPASQQEDTEDESLFMTDNQLNQDEAAEYQSNELLDDLSEDHDFSDRMSVDDEASDEATDEDQREDTPAPRDTDNALTIVPPPPTAAQQQINDNNSDVDEIRAGRPTGVSEVVDILFEIHTALKTRHLGQRTAASALAASNLVSSVAYPSTEPIPRDEQLETLENTRKMLECAICQEVFTSATEATCCGQIFCKECIERWVSERASCPMCREDISFSLLRESRHSQRMANEMQVNCTYCSKSMKKAVLSDHMDTCDKAPLEPPPPVDVTLRLMLISSARLNAANLQRFLLAPSPPEALVMQCYIRTRGSGNYELFTQDSDILLCTAVRRRQLDMSVTFSIHLANSNSDISNNPSAQQVARLERNFVGSQYTVFNTTEDQATEIGAVQYAATFGKTPRQMRVALPTVSQVSDNNADMPMWNTDRFQQASREDNMLAQIERPDSSRAINLINKPPVWIESLEAYCLDFGGRVAAASVKNFLLSHPDDMDKTMMLFGRTSDRQVYSMDYRHPFSPVQAFAIALSSMDSHLVTFD